MSDWKTEIQYEDVQVAGDLVRVKYRTNFGIIVVQLDREAIEDFYGSQTSGGELYAEHADTINESIASNLIHRLSSIIEFPAVLSFSSDEFERAMNSGAA